jgi:hypothetical protein
VFEGYITEEQLSVVLFLRSKEHSEKAIHKEMFSVTVVNVA